MSRFPESVRPDALRQSLADLRRRVDSASAAVATAVVTGWTDAQPRWVRVTKQYTDFADPGSVVAVVLGNYPAGTVFTHVRINPTTIFATTLTNAVVAEAIVPTNGALADGSTKTVNLAVSPPLADQAATIYMLGDPDAASDFKLEISISGGETGNDLIAGVVAVDMLLSVPGATTDDLPHA